jgi:glycine/D-amino acid oxidase-like deaminating enzyme
LAGAGAADRHHLSTRPYSARTGARLTAKLTPVQVSADRVIRDVAGSRPFRPSGFRLETQQVGGKIVVHNYGHGGGGVTLSWGTAELAVEGVQSAGHQQYAVLGSGAVGLATARLLQQRGAHVTIYAKDLPPHTTSNIAGALFRPGTGFDPERAAPAFFDRFERAIHISHRHFEAMIGERYGIRRLDNYFLGDQPLVNAEILVDARISDRIRDLYPQAAELAQDQHPFPARFVNRHQIPLCIQCRSAHPDAMNSNAQAERTMLS